MELARHTTENGKMINYVSEARFILLYITCDIINLLRCETEFNRFSTSCYTMEIYHIEAILSPVSGQRQVLVLI